MRSHPAALPGQGGRGTPPEPGRPSSLLARPQVPCYSYGQKLSKLAILRIACNYILSLARLADLDYSADHSNLSFSECVQRCTRTLQAEGRAKKRKVGTRCRARPRGGQAREQDTGPTRAQDAPGADDHPGSGILHPRTVGGTILRRWRCWWPWTDTQGVWARVLVPHTRKTDYPEAPETCVCWCRVLVALRDASCICLPLWPWAGLLSPSPCALGTHAPL